MSRLFRAWTPVAVLALLLAVLASATTSPILTVAQHRLLGTTESVAHVSGLGPQIADSAASTQACVPAPPGLVSWWPGESNVDDIIGDNDGSPNPSLAYTDGMVGAAIDLDGRPSSYVSVPDDPSLDLVGEITIELWFNADTFENVFGLVAKRPPNEITNYAINNYNGRLGLYYNDPTLCCFGDDGNIFELARTSSLSAGVFHHFAGTFKQISAEQVELKIYIDGALTRSLVQPGNLSRTVNDVPLTIGRSNAGGEPFSGIIDEVSIYNRAISADEVLAIFQADSKGKCHTLPPTTTPEPTSIPTSTSTPDEIRLVVTPLKQGVAPYLNEGGTAGMPTRVPDNKPSWEDSLYDHASADDFKCEQGYTIANCGCALTSAAMVLLEQGIVKGPDGRATDPESLNDFLKGNTCPPDGPCTTKTGYNKSGGVFWDAIASYSALAHQRFPDQPKLTFKTHGGQYFPLYDPALIRAELCAGNPVILKMENAGHFIVATGVSGNTFTINDPFHDRHLLTDYNETPRTMRLYHSSSGTTCQQSPASLQVSAMPDQLSHTMTASEFDEGESRLSVITYAPVTALIADEDGRLAGYSGGRAEEFLGIPRSSVGYELSIRNPSALLVPRQIPDTNVVNLDIPTPGQIRVTVSPNSTLGFSASLHLYNAQGELALHTLVGASGSIDDVLYDFVLSSALDEPSIVQAVGIDLKPDDDSNTINPRSNGVIPVAILTSSSLDARSLHDLRLGPLGAQPVRQSVVSDVDDDGDLDVVAHFRMKDIGISPTDVEVCLSALFTDGFNARGCNAIRIVPALNAQSASQLYRANR